ncbi:MAG: alpha/beta hydrolase [Promicromonosporaceae bacterium]|nr:alpha/beta hydrolase [Promicromonosporaceae bacterium]
MAISNDWRSDDLGPDFEQATLYTRDDAEATLIRHVPSTSVDVTGELGSAESVRPVAVLYLHGFVDYFFHPHVAEALSDAGYAFYAVDLRGYGRSMEAHIEAGHDPNMVPDIGVHAADLDAAAAAIRARGHEKLVLLAHSMGGLVGTLWSAGAHPDSGLRADALVLNSPWFDLNENALLRGVGTDAIAALATVAPHAPVGSLAPHYGKALHLDTGGEWAYNLPWKPHGGFPVQASWLSSIRRGHRRIMNWLIDLEIPVLVVASTRSGNAKDWHPEVITTDSVLDVGDIAVGASRIGGDVTFVQIPGGAHDLALSRQQARSEYLATIVDWLESRVPPDGSN